MGLGRFSGLLQVLAFLFTIEAAIEMERQQVDRLFQSIRVENSVSTDAGVSPKGRKASLNARLLLLTSSSVGSMPFDAFLALWARTASDRDLVPEGGQSSRQASARMQAFLASMRGQPGPVAAVTHGRVMTDLLRDLPGEDAPPPHVLEAGILPCAVTAVDDLNAVMIASVSHLT